MPLPNQDSVIAFLPFDLPPQDNIAAKSVIDHSPWSNAVTTYGPQPLTADQTAGGGYLGRFGAAFGGVGILAPSNLAIGTSDFTVEGRFRVAGSSTSVWLGVSGLANTANLANLYVRNGAFHFYGTSQSNMLTHQTAIQSGVWYDFAVVRSAGVITTFVNGIKSATTIPFSNSLSMPATGIMVGATGYPNSEYFDGDIDYYLLTLGIAKYSANYTPAAPSYTPRAPTVGSATARLTLSDFTPPANISDIKPALLKRDLYYGGRGTLRGTVKEKASPANLPLVRRVVLYRQREFIPLAEAWSGTDGSYSFPLIDESEKYFVVSFDHTGAYRGVVADNLMPEVI